MNTKVKKALAGLAFGLVMAACGSANAAVGVQFSPYMIYPNVPTSMTVAWWDYAPSTTDTISWGTDTTYSAGSATVSTTAFGNGGTGSDLGTNWTSPKDMGKYTITGLNTNTKYYYQVVDASGKAWTGSFYTAPDPGATSVKFLAQGDSRSQPYALDGLDQVMLQFINQPGNAEYQRLSIANGDWVSTDGDQYWAAEWFQSGQTNVRAYTANVPMNGCKGNHDNKSGWSASFSKYYPYPYVDSRAFTPATPASHSGLTSCTANSSNYCVDSDGNPYYNNLFWSFDYGPVHVTVIDEYSSMAVGSAQYNFVHDDLANTTKPWKIVLYHEPSYSAGHDGDNTAVRVFEPLFTQYGVDAIFAGHSHNYARTGVYNSTQAGSDVIAANIPHFTSGGGGAPVYNVDITNNGSYPHVITAWPAIEFMTFDVQGDTMTMNSYQATGINPAASAPQTGTLGYQMIEKTVLHHWTDVSSQLGVKVGAISYNRTNKTYNGTVTITNNGANLAGNLDVVLDGILNLNGLGTPDNEYAAGAGQAGFMQMIASNPAMYKSGTTGALISNVKVVNQTDSQNGEPMVHATSSGLAAGSSVSFPVQFQFSSSVYNSTAQNNNGKITFNTKILNH